VRPWFEEQVAEDWVDIRDRAMFLLQKETELQEIVQLVGPDALPETEKIILEVARMLREDFLQQNAFRDDDQFSSLIEQDLLLKAILQFHDAAIAAQQHGAALKDIFAAPVREKIARAKYTTSEELGVFDEIASDIETQLVVGSGVGV